MGADRQAYEIRLTTRQSPTHTDSTQAAVTYGPEIVGQAVANMLADPPANFEALTIRKVES